jgi:hypothetical protein
MYPNESLENFSSSDNKRLRVVYFIFIEVKHIHLIVSLLVYEIPQSLMQLISNDTNTDIKCRYQT